MKDHRLASPTWKKQLAELWPALKGSLAKVHKPCIRKNCVACARGQGHPAWLLSFTDRRRRKTMYVPQALIPTLKRALQNGRKIEQILYRTGPNLIKAFRRTTPKPAKGPFKS